MNHNKTFVVLALLLCLPICMGSQGCEADKSNQESASGAKQAQPITVKKNAHGLTMEQQNIEDRIKVTTDPAKVLWVHLIALDGKIIKRMPVTGKVTSSGKRLEPKSVTPDGQNVQTSSLPKYNGYLTTELIGPDGTYGDSDAYIFWFDPMHRYHQYGTAGGLGYLLTDYPIDLENPMDMITGMYKVNEAAAQWQREQETKLKVESTNK